MRVEVRNNNQYLSQDVYETELKMSYDESNMEERENEKYLLNKKKIQEATKKFFTF